MTLEQFEQKLKELLSAAESAGNSSEDICAIVEHTLEHGWNDNEQL